MYEPKAPPMADVGDVLDGKYRLTRLIGEGGMAFVYEAVHVKLGQRVAIKVLAPELARDREIVMRFEREARAVAHLRTPHVAHVIDVDTSPEGVSYIVMELLEGRDLDAELEARGALPVPEAVDYILQASAAMHEAHASGIIHRDLKPANLFLGRQGQARIVKVLDFGISKVLGDARKLTAATAVMGTVIYMSPEQVRASSNVDARSDLWSLGVLLHELLSGRPPWEGTPPQIAGMIVSTDPPRIETLANVPEGVAFTVRRMLERDPARRFASAAEVIAALAPFAPAGSLGLQIADQIAPGAGSLGPLSPRQARTAPLLRGPHVPHTPASGFAVAPISSPDPVQLRSPESSDRWPAAPAPAPSTQARGVVALIVLLLVAAAVGAMLIAIALHRGRSSSPFGREGGRGGGLQSDSAPSDSAPKDGDGRGGRR